MRLVRAAVLVALGAAVAIAADRLVIQSPDPAHQPPPLLQRGTGPRNPPVVWLDGRVEEVSEAHFTLREGRGPRVRVERLAEGATVFFHLGEEGWSEAPPDAAIAPGDPACIQTLLDGRVFLALRVFVGAGCGPVEAR